MTSRSPVERACSETDTDSVMWSGDEDCGGSLVSELLCHSLSVPGVPFSSASEGRVCPVGWKLICPSCSHAECDAISASVSLGFIPSGIESGTRRDPCRWLEPQCRPSGERVEVVVATASACFIDLAREVL